MVRALLAVAFVTMIVGRICAQTPTGTIVIYRHRGANFGLLHYAQGVHPTVSCDGINVAKMAESRKATVTANAGTHSCVAIEKQYPGELNADSDPVSLNVKPNGTTYLRLECPFGHVHFELREVAMEIGLAEDRGDAAGQGQGLIHHHSAYAATAANACFAAAIVCCRSRSVCAVPRNAASNCDGGR